MRAGCPVLLALSWPSHNLVTTVWLWRWLSNRFKLHSFQKNGRCWQRWQDHDKTWNKVPYCLLGLDKLLALHGPNNWSQILTNKHNYENIAQNITKRLQDSLSDISPVTRVQIPTKSTNPLSKFAHETLVQRHCPSGSKRQSVSWQYSLLQTNAKPIISKEFYDRKEEEKNFQYQTSDRHKWKSTKAETGQNKHSTPSVIIEGQSHFTKPRDMANALNRQYISSIRDIINKIPPTTTNPLEHYSKFLGPNDFKIGPSTNHNAYP